MAAEAFITGWPGEGARGLNEFGMGMRMPRMGICSSARSPFSAALGNAAMSAMLTCGSHYCYWFDIELAGSGQYYRYVIYQGALIIRIAFVATMMSGVTTYISCMTYMQSGRQCSPRLNISPRPGMPPTTVSRYRARFRRHQ